MKKAKVETSENSNEELQGQYDKLDAIQAEIEKLNDEATEEILQIEKQYNGKRKPYYKQRNDVIRDIPAFWSKAFLNHDMLCDLLDEEDQKVFQHMKELTVEDFDDVKSGFKITFTFDANPYFKNKTLHKEFRYNADGQLSVHPSKIEWKEGMDLTKLRKATPKPETGKRSREMSETESFFNWFNPEDQDLELGEIIKEDLWPNPAKYYHGGDEVDEELDPDECEAEEVDDDVPDDELAEEEDGEDDGEDDQ